MSALSGPTKPARGTEFRLNHKTLHFSPSPSNPNHSSIDEPGCWPHCVRQRRRVADARRGRQGAFLLLTECTIHEAPLHRFSTFLTIYHPGPRTVFKDG